MPASRVDKSWQLTNELVEGSAIYAEDENNILREKEISRYW